MTRSGLPYGSYLRLGADAWTLGLRIGLNKGYETTAIPNRVKPSHLKGKLSKKTQFVRSVVREVVGFAPYERRVLELLRNSKVCTIRSPTSTFAQPTHLVQDKKARKLTKKRVLHSPFPTFCVLWTLIECFFALSSSAPFCVQNASWRNSQLSSRRAGGPVTN